MIKFLIWIPSIILFVLSIILTDTNRESERSKKAKNIMNLSIAISFVILISDIIFIYKDISLYNYSFIKTIIEIFKIAWWRILLIIDFIIHYLRK